jgi:hypothetical protein
LLDPFITTAACRRPRGLRCVDCLTNQLYSNHVDVVSTLASGALA